MDSDAVHHLKEIRLGKVVQIMTVNCMDNEKDFWIMSWTNTEMTFSVIQYHCIETGRIHKYKGFGEMIIKQSLEELEEIIEKRKAKANKKDV